MSTIVHVPAGLFRAGLAAVVQHAGRETDDTPDAGRVRVHLTPTHLLLWATDRVTAALARVEIADVISGELDGCDLPVESVRKILAVFTPPSNQDQRQMWVDEPFRVEITAKRVTVTEVGSMVEGESLTVDRIQPAGEDRYPDVPRLLVNAIAGRDATVPARPDMTSLARFTASAKAYASHLAGRPWAYVLAGSDLVVRIGTVFLGMCPNRWAEDPEKVDRATTDWTPTLIPLRRPEPVDVAESVVDELREQAEQLLREHGAEVTLHVVRDGGEDQ